jgi:predicted nucleotidyltransferase
MQILCELVGVLQGMTLSAGGGWYRRSRVALTGPELREFAVGELRRRLGDLPEYVRAVILFGSVARGEAGERSDVDLLVLHSGMTIGDPVLRRRYLYNLVAERLEGVFESITVVDEELGEFLNPRTVTPLLLNIYVDSVVVLDRVGVIEEFLQYVRGRIRELGLRRVRDGRAYYWTLPKPLERVRLL